MAKCGISTLPLLDEAGTVRESAQKKHEFEQFLFGFVNFSLGHTGKELFAMNDKYETLEVSYGIVRVQIAWILDVIANMFEHGGPLSIIGPHDLVHGTLDPTGNVTSKMRDPLYQLFLPRKWVHGGAGACQ